MLSLLLGGHEVHHVSAPGIRDGDPREASDLEVEGVAPLTENEDLPQRQEERIGECRVERLLCFGWTGCFISLYSRLHQ